ncbi:MAG: FtsX-like permease family protein [Acidobacteria bacterium]|nr:FtsX-like permease family protein [Acidobacteriota bacterium]
MTRSKMLLQVIGKALWVRPGKLLLSVAALTVGATLASAFLSLYFDLPEKMSAEFRTLGPNLIMAPRGDGQTFPASVVAQVADINGDVSRLPWLYAVGRADGRDVILGGTELAHLARMHPSWKGLPPAPAAEGLIAGEKAAEVFGWQPGEAVRIAYGEGEISLPLTGIVSTGGSEDSQLLVPLATLQSLTGQAGRLSLIQLAAPGTAAEVESTWRQMAASVANFPEVEIRALRPVLESEARVVMKVRGLMLGLAGIVLALVVLSVLTNVSGRILDRQKDIGVMKALGGSDASIAHFFLAETAAQALFAAALGFGVGFALAQVAAERIFHSAITMRWDVAAAVTGITLGVALIATVLPSRWIRRMDPAVILRGE